MNEIIKLEDVNFQYESDELGTQVLKDITIAFEKGSFTAVLGHNGSGKSTLAKLLNATNLPNTGKVFVDGLDTADEKNRIPIKRNVGMVFQNPDNQIVATIVDEDVAFGLENIGVAPAEMRKRVDAALKAVDMFEYKKASTTNLSGGQKQRIAIAGVIAMQPSCLVLDEPTAMLDPKGRKEVIGTILHLCKNEGKTVVLITHHMNEAALADRVVVIDNGEILLDGSPGQVFSEVELLKNIGLDVPQSSELIFELKKAGIDLSDKIVDVNGCVKALTDALLEEN